MEEPSDILNGVLTGRDVAVSLRRISPWFGQMVQRLVLYMRKQGQVLMVEWNCNLGKPWILGKRNCLDMANKNERYWEMW